MRKLKRLINNLIDAEIALSWIGNTDPSSWKEIKSIAKKARKKLYEEIEKAFETTQQKRIRTPTRNR